MVNHEVGFVRKTSFFDKAYLPVHLLRCRHYDEIPMCIVLLKGKSSRKIENSYGNVHYSTTLPRQDNLLGLILQFHGCVSRDPGRLFGRQRP